MLAINIIAIIWAGAMFLCYKPVHAHMTTQGNTSEKTADNISYKEAGTIVFLAIFIVSLLIRIVSSVVYVGNESDMGCFMSWSDMVFNDGIGQFYKSDAFHDYPPGYMYILYIVGAVKSLFGVQYGSPMCLLITKLPAVIADMITGYLVYRIASKKTDEVFSAILSGMYLLCPAIILDSAVWGQTDAVFTLFIVIMCYLVTEKKLVASYFVFAVAILIKPQSLILTPVLICAIIDQVFLENFNWKKFFGNLLPGICAILMIGILIMPFGFKEALSQYTDTLGSYEYATINAYNIWTVFGLNWVSQYGKAFGTTYQNLGTIAIVAIVVLSIYVSIKCKKKESKYYFIGALIVTSVFTFSVRMHERYLFPAMVLLLLCYVCDARKDIYMLYTAVCTVVFYNVAHVLFVYDINNFDNKAPIPIAIGMCEVAVAVILIYTALRRFGKTSGKKDESLKQISRGHPRNKGHNK